VIQATKVCGQLRIFFNAPFSGQKIVHAISIVTPMDKFHIIDFKPN